MGKATRKRQDDEPVVNPFAANHGDYRREPMPVTAGELGEERGGNVLVTRNRGGTTVERWLTSKQLTESQANGIAFYQTMWHRVFSEPRVTANWSLVAFIRGMPEDRRLNEIDAKEALKLLDERIFQIAPEYYFTVWQNVVIFDQAAGVAGGDGSRSSADRAKNICQFIADVIATVMRL